MKVVLNVPEDLDVQFVYRMIRNELYITQIPSEFTFFYLDSLQSALQHRAALGKAWGLAAYIKTVAKLMSKKRSLYIVKSNNELAAFGWCSTGFCTHYRTDLNALVIGPIETYNRFQSKGLGSTAMMLAINSNIKRGISTFYIDTQRTNKAAQKTFAKCGFGEPIALYQR